MTYYVVAAAYLVGGIVLGGGAVEVLRLARRAAQRSDRGRP